MASAFTSTNAGNEIKLFTRNSKEYTNRYGYGEAMKPVILQAVVPDSYAHIHLRFRLCRAAFAWSERNRGCVCASAAFLDGEIVTWNRKTESFEAFGGNRTVALRS